MDIEVQVMRLRGLSNEDLQASLGALLGTGRKLTAIVIAHLGEIEERRLHLLGGSRSMFDYCTVRLGMSEDEACRRIEVARLALRFPVLLERLASGAVSLSVAALLKNCLTDANQGTLLAAVSGKTVGQAREALVAWFPRPDVPDSIRKLPERMELASASVGTTIAPQGAPASSEVPPAAEVETLEATSERGEATQEADQLHTGSVEPAATEQSTLTSKPPPMRRTRDCRLFKPLSPGRFKVTFTANAELKQKIERARDLMRHAVPDGDLASIVGRAIDLLLEEKERRRFAKLSKRSTKSKPHGEPEQTAADPPCSSNLNRDAPATTSRAAASGATCARNRDSSRGAAPFDADAPASSDTPLDGNTPSNTGAAASSDARPEDDAPANTEERANTDAPAISDVLVNPDAPANTDALTNADAPANTEAPSSDDPRSPSRAPTGSNASISKAPGSSTATARESRHLPNAVRRAVVERDGMRCSWQAPDGTRCNSRAWLEYDHTIPRGCGGTNDPSNIRPFCRAHNRLAAEQAYGKATIARIIARRRAARGQPATHVGPADSDLGSAPI